MKPMLTNVCVSRKAKHHYCLEDRLGVLILSAQKAKNRQPNYGYEPYLYYPNVVNNYEILSIIYCQLRIGFISNALKHFLIVQFNAKQLVWQKPLLSDFA